MRLLLLLLTVVACGGGAASSPQPISNQPPPQPMIAQAAPAQTKMPPDCPENAGANCIVGQMEYFERRMCDCKDKACADSVNETMTKWGTKMASRASKDEKPSPGLAKLSADIMTKYVECMTKLMMGGHDMPSPPPDPCGGQNPCGD